MSALPKAVQAQIKAADELATQFRASLQPPAEPAAPAAAVAAEPPPPEGAPAAAAPPAAPAVIAAPAGEETFEKRYRVLQGKYNAEVPRLQQTVRDQATSISSMQNQLNLLMVQSTRPQAAAPAPAAPAPASKQLVTDAEVKAFGSDLIDVVRRVAREEMPAVDPNAVTSIDTRVKQVERTVEAGVEEANQRAYDKMMTLLNAQVPDWEQMNLDEGFITWLDQLDAYSGAKRQSMLNFAFNHNDGPRVVAFFKGYQTEHATLNPAPAPAAEPAPAAPAATLQPLDKLIAPGTAKAGAGGAPNEASKRIWTNAEIHAFNQRKNQFVVSRKPIPASMVETEREIIAAAREGRVR